jgi:hypothetical protein
MMGRRAISVLVAAFASMVCNGLRAIFGAAFLLRDSRTIRAFFDFSCAIRTFVRLARLAGDFFAAVRGARACVFGVEVEVDADPRLVVTGREFAGSVRALPFITSVRTN